jgi:hypothetical protein
MLRYSGRPAEALALRHIGDLVDDVAGDGRLGVAL